jgi:hypothetical protein
MEIHKPHAAKSWKEFFIELGTIVLGICIALAGEQLIDDLHWRNQVAEAQRAVAAEMAQNVGTAIVTWRNQTCAERRLDEVAQILDKAAATGVLPPVGEIGRPAPRLWRTGTWESLVASQVVTHFPRQQLAALASVYTAVRRADDTPEADVWTDLSAISGPGRRLDPASEAALRKALGSARSIARRRASLSAVILALTAQQHLPYSSQDLDFIAAMRRAAQNSEKGGVPWALTQALPGGFSLCRPIGAVPANYGQAPPGTAEILTDEKLNALPDFGAP